MDSYEELEVWQRAIDLVDDTYDLVKKLPSDERFGLVSQMQRASVSVPANIAEGWARDSTKDFLRHLSIAKGSLAELTTFWVIVQRRGFVPEPQLSKIRAKSSSVGRLLSGLQRALRNKLENFQPVVRPHSKK
jgi:four helix bundle protein